MTVKVGTADVPTTALCIGTKNESSFAGTHQYNEVLLLDPNVPDAVDRRSAEWAGSLVCRWFRERDPRGLNRFQRRLHFCSALVALHRFFGQASLNDAPQARRDRWAESAGNLAHDGGADFKTGPSTEGQATRSGFVENNAERPEITTAVCGIAAQDFRGHVGQSAAYAGGAKPPGCRPQLV